MNVENKVIANGKTNQGDEYSVTTEHLIITFQDELFIFEIKEISQEGVVQWEEQDRYSVAFQYQEKSYEFPSLYPYYPDIINAIKEARSQQKSDTNQTETQDPFPDERLYSEIISALEQDKRITIHERISLVNYFYKQILSDLNEIVGASEKTNAKDTIQLARDQEIITMLQSSRLNRFRLFRNDLVHGRIEFFPTDLLLQVHEILRSIIR